MIPIAANDYQIVFNKNGYAALNSLLQSKKYSTLYILVDENTNEHCLPHFLSQLATESPIEIIEIESGEQNKSIEICVELWRILSEYGADKKSLLINLGGGVLTDLGGFIATTFKRGIDFIHIPTTLLAMVDASVGGKNGIDLDGIKNQIGTITTPQLVLIDITFLETLSQKELLSGLAEMLKHGIIADAKYWKRFLSLDSLDFKDLEHLIYRSIEIKNSIVLEDPTEKGLRKALNFGHTIGHALESYFLENPLKNTLLHGEAIAIGMILEARIAHDLKLLGESDLEEIQNRIESLYTMETLDESDIQEVMRRMKFDKKNEYGTIQFALPRNIGSVEVNIVVENSLIYKALRSLKS